MLSLFHTLVVLIYFFIIFLLTEHSREGILVKDQVKVVFLYRLCDTDLAYRGFWRSVLKLRDTMRSLPCFLLVRVEVCLPLVPVPVGNSDMIP